MNSNSPIAAGDASGVSYRLSDLESHRRKLFQSEREHKLLTQTDRNEPNIDQEYVTFRRDGYVTLGRNANEGHLISNNSMIPASGMMSGDWNKQRQVREEDQFETFNDGRSLNGSDDEAPRSHPQRVVYHEEPLSRSRPRATSKDAKSVSASADFNAHPSQTERYPANGSQGNPFFTDDNHFKSSGVPQSTGKIVVQAGYPKQGHVVTHIPKQGYLSRGMLMLRNRRTDSKSRREGSKTPGKSPGPTKGPIAHSEPIKVFDQIKKQAIQTVQSRLNFPN